MIELSEDEARIVRYLQWQADRLVALEANSEWEWRAAQAQAAQHYATMRAIEKGKHRD